MNMYWFWRKSTRDVPTGNPYYYAHAPPLPMYPTLGNYNHPSVVHAGTPYYTGPSAGYIILHPLLSPPHESTSTSLTWDTRFPPSYALYSEERSRRLSLSEVRVPAVRPKRRGVRIVVEYHPKWHIDVVPLSKSYLLVEDVLLAIFHFLHRHVSLLTWQMLGDRGKKHAHVARYERLAKGPVEYESDSKVKNVDLLGLRTLFGGLRVIGQNEWSVTLLKRRDRI